MISSMKNILNRQLFLTKPQSNTDHWLNRVTEMEVSGNSKLPPPPSRVAVRLSGSSGVQAPFQARLKFTMTMTRCKMAINNAPEVVFLVDGKKIPVHKHLLLRSSPVFIHMLDGPFAEKGVIQIYDASPEDFEHVMNALYEGVGAISKLSSISQVLRCWMISHKYNIKLLEVGILNVVLKRLIYSNVAEVLSLPFVELGIVPDVTSKCWSIIERDTLKVIKSSGFLLLSWQNIIKILENSRLTVPEYQLARAVIGWCKNQREINRKTLVDNLGVAVYQIRFPLMTPREFDLICKLGILRSGEIKDLRANFRTNTTFKTALRRNKCSCCTKKIYCPLCSVKWSPRKQKNADWKSTVDLNASITTDWNNNSNAKKKPMVTTKRRMAPLITPSSTPPPTEGGADDASPCECIKYLSCPNFANGLTAKLMRLNGIGGFN